MTDALREALLREALGHLKGYKMSMLARTRENLIAAIERALQEPAPVVAREPTPDMVDAAYTVVRRSTFDQETSNDIVADLLALVVDGYRAMVAAAPQAPVEPAPVVAHSPYQPLVDAALLWHAGAPYDTEPALVEELLYNIVSEFIAKHPDLAAPVEPAPVVQPDTGVVYERGYWQGIEDAGNRAESLRPAWGTAALEIAAAIRNIAVGGSQLVEDARRLDWVCRNISGKAWREAGVTYSSGSPFDMRCAIDAAIRSIAKGVGS